MSEDALKVLSELTSDAHAQIQLHSDLNPVVEVRRGQRDGGMPADVMTIDCLQSRRRILLILHDHEPGVLLHQFMTMDEDVGAELQRMPLSDLTVATLVGWMENHFTEQPPD
ncbi:MAG: hypothetical protein EA349_07610 [Halomonadaceae bacterium]|nr:MAG: hypothetical protein EA349_07610 [Halomonadaceae bacterium]